MHSVPDNLKERIAKIKIIFLDNDGVLTDGRIVFGDYGDELKFYYAHDAEGLHVAREAGLVTVLLAPGRSRIVSKWGKEANLRKVYQNAKDKLKLFEKALRKFKARPEEACYVGDDLTDLSPMKRAGFAVAVRNAVPEVKAMAHYTTERSGGRGAVREVVDIVLQGKNLWGEVIERHYR